MMTLLLIHSLLNNALLICIEKWKILDHYELRKKKWMPDWCTFCFFFWTSLLFYILYFIRFELSAIKIVDAIVAALACSILSLIVRKHIS